ncbi:hypothetical protein C7T94_01785 [Pedobacter yulinensis]|uniref:Acyltransferase 3 domain-containing protein n=2 Tax=Pedobacter yulinensis TaxID=2126353 RepID=A0A2T3HQZ2_9SPHI|nr:hypothetical protein C7T94_01785 [Pedobacter yulinensis]
MMGIVFEHCTYAGTYLFDTFTPRLATYVSLIQFPKFGTVAFFMLAGFLLGEKFFTYTPWEYFRRRLQTTIKPWLFWSLLFVGAMFLKTWIIEHKSAGFSLGETLAQTVQRVYLFTNYWFIINFLVCIGTLLLFRRFLYSWWLGLVLLLVTLVYAFNIHLLWFFPVHTTAIFGFVFFLWLGACLHRNWEQVSILLDRVPHLVFVLLFAGTFYLSVYEIQVLYAQQVEDPFNTLRLSNLLYSLCAVFWLLKIRSIPFTRFFQPRDTTFGIYLIHYILVYNFLPELLRPLGLLNVQDLSLIEIILSSVGKFVVVYLTTFALVKLIARSPLRGLIGR